MGAIINSKIYPFILAGGIGARLWPLSTPECPKPFLSLNNDQSILQQTLQRLNSAGFHPASIICSAAHEALAKAQLKNENPSFIFESQAKGTAYSILIAAFAALDKDPQAQILIMPSDHYIEDNDVFIEVIKKASKTLQQTNAFATFGIEPTHAHTGYGYIKAQNNKVLNFTEKPDSEKAKEFIAQGGYYWNAGIFLFPAARLVNDMKIYAQAIYLQALKTWQGACKRDGAIFFTEPEQGQDFEPISIDYALMEQADNVMVFALKTRWSDLGTWQALAEHLCRCNEGAEKISRAWGHYRILSKGQGYLIKELVIKPAQKTSLQYHNERSEFWFVLEGVLSLLKNEQHAQLNTGESVYISVAEPHRLQNETAKILRILEVQIGQNLSEDDIVRMA